MVLFIKENTWLSSEEVIQESKHAIDLAGICSKVTVFEFLEELKADQVLQEKAKSLPNVEILVNSQTTEVVGDKEKVTGIRTKDRTTGYERLFPLDGIFVQIGLAPIAVLLKKLSRPIVWEKSSSMPIAGPTFRVSMQPAMFPPSPINKLLSQWEKEPSSTLSFRRPY